MDSCCVSLARTLDRWLDRASHHDCGIIFMYRNIEIGRNKEPPAKPITRTHYDGCLMRFASVSTRETLGRARELLKDRFRVIIRCFDTDATVRGGSAKSRRMHGGGVLARSSCARLARCFSFESFYCDASVRLLLL